MFYSTFFGIELGKKSLMTHQLAMHTTAQNIANSGTPGYSRQKNVLIATDPFNAPQMNRLELPGQLGTGVTLQSIQRARDMLLENEIRREISGQSSLDHKVKYMEQVEAALQEPSDMGIGKALDNFWASWQEVSANPEEIAARNTVLSRADQLVKVLQKKDTDFAQLQAMTDQEIRTQVAQINELASKIRDINVEINKSLGVEMQPNDLLDKRDFYLRELAEITNYQGQQMGNGLYSITINGRTLVQDGTFIPLNVSNDPLNHGFAAITWSDDNSPVTITSGQIAGLAEMRDSVIPSYRNSLNTLAQGIMNTVNPAHAAGYGLNAAAPSGQPLFTGTDLASMALNPALAGNPAGLAAATNPSAPGDGSNALAMAQLQNSLSMAGGTQTIGTYYQNMIAQIGLDSKNMKLDQANQDAIVDSLDEQQKSVAGVNMDEEMTNMMKYQDAYQAAIRVVSTMDEMLNTLINQMGLVGR